MMKDGEVKKQKETWEDVKETVHNLKEKLPKQFSSPSLSIFNESFSDSLVNATGALSLSLSSTRGLRERARTLGSDIRRIRSKSCDRVLQKCRRGLEKVVRKDPQPSDNFHQITTLRRSRRSAKTKAKPSKQSYDCYARALVNYTPSPYDVDGLPLRVGDLIGVINRHPSGMWVGECEGRVGRFKFINVEMVETKSDTSPSISDQENISSMSSLLNRIGLSHLISKLELNGFDQLESLETVTRTDLEFLGITNKEEQDKLIEVATSLRSSSAQKGREEERLDSGCYDCHNFDENGLTGDNLPVLRARKHDQSSTLSSTPRSSLCSSPGSGRREDFSTLSTLSGSHQDLSVFSLLPSHECPTPSVLKDSLMHSLGDEDRGRRTKYSPARRGISILSSCERVDTDF